MKIRLVIVLAVVLSITAAALSSLFTYYVTIYDPTLPQQWKASAVEWLDVRMAQNPSWNDYYDEANGYYFIQSHDTLRRLQDYVRRGTAREYDPESYQPTDSKILMAGYTLIDCTGFNLGGAIFQPVFITFTPEDSQDFENHLSSLKNAP